MNGIEGWGCGLLCLVAAVSHSLVTGFLFFDSPRICKNLQVSPYPQYPVWAKSLHTSGSKSVMVVVRTFAATGFSGPLVSLCGLLLTSTAAPSSVSNSFLLLWSSCLEGLCCFGLDSGLCSVRASVLSFFLSLDLMFGSVGSSATGSSATGFLLTLSLLTVLFLNMLCCVGAPIDAIGF